MPKVILSGREINDNMGMFIGQKVETLMQEKQINLSKSKNTYFRNHVQRKTAQISEIQKLRTFIITLKIKTQRFMFTTLLLMQTKLKRNLILN